jgi:thioredoxin reductase (NADPH)
VHDTVVVGGGVAGLTAALFAARGGCATLVLVPLPGVPGGQLVTIDRVEDFPGFIDGIAGYELGPRLQEQAANAGAEFQMAEAERLEAITDGWRIATSDGAVEAKTVIIATGSHPRQLGVPGEERLVGRGVSHCASCDGPLLRDKPVAVVGAGDSGLQEALTLASFASEVLVLHRSELPTGLETYQQRVRDAANIRLQGNTVVEEILGDGVVSGLRVRDTVNGDAAAVDTSAVFIYVGLEPNTAFIQDVIRLDEGRRIPTDIWMRTELPGVFAVGDVRSNSASQAITTAGDGATAAIAARRYLDAAEHR